jgi:hypothetical protein
MLPERLDVGYISEFVIEESKISLDDTTTGVDVRSTDDVFTVLDTIPPTDEDNPCKMVELGVIDEVFLLVDPGP